MNEFFSRYRKYFSLFGILILIVIIPIVILFSQQQQDFREHAAMAPVITPPPGCSIQGAYMVCPLANTHPVQCNYTPLCRLNGIQCGLPNRIGPCPAISFTPSITPPPGCHYQYIGVACAQGITCTPISPILVCPSPSKTPSPNPSCIPLPTCAYGAIPCPLANANYCPRLTPTPMQNTIIIKNMQFTPPTWEINPGTTVTWVNQDTVAHQVVSDTLITPTDQTGATTDIWDSGILQPGQSFSYTFKTSGQHPYHCNIHPTMTGSIQVRSITPTPSVNTTPTIIPGDTSLVFAVYLHGLAKGGDNANPTSTGNQIPLHLQRPITVNVYDANNNLALTKEWTTIYNAGGFFDVNMDAGTLASGIYTVSVKVPGYLQKTMLGIKTITEKQANTLNPAPYLVTGDINNDNQLDILDYNLLISCYGSKSNTPDCKDKTASDLTDDGTVDGSDYNLFLRELSVQPGDTGGGTITPTPTVSAGSFCGTVMARGTQFINSDPQDAETCFFQAYQQCQPKTFVFKELGVDTGTTHEFSLKNNNTKCDIIDNVTNVVAPVITPTIQIYTCNSVTQPTNGGLLVTDCGAEGSITIPSALVTTPLPSQTSCQSQGSCLNGATCPSGTVCSGMPVNQCYPVGCPYPICLASNTKIATPNGDVLVTQLQPGMLVWTIDHGRKVAKPIIRTTKTPVPSTHHVVHIVLADKREVFASPHHPTADGRTVDQVKVGDSLDGSSVTAVAMVVYWDTATYDLLPASTTGYYYANGILLGSTLRRN